MVDPIADDDGVWAIIDDWCNSCCHVEVCRHNAEAKMKVFRCSSHLAAQKCNCFQQCRNEHDKRVLKISMAIRLQESDMVIPGCVHSHEILEKAHPLLLSQACQAKLGTTKRVREGTVTLDDYDAQSLEVAQQEGTGLFMIRIDHLIHDVHVYNPLLDDLVIDVGAELDVNNVARGPHQPLSSDCFTHAWSITAVANFRRVCFRLTRLS